MLKTNYSTPLGNPMINFFCSLLVFFILFGNVAIAQSFTALEKLIQNESDVKVKLATLEKAQLTFDTAPIAEQAKYWRLLSLTQQENSLFQASIDSATQAIAIIENNSAKLPRLLAQSYIVRSNSIYKVESSQLTYCDDIEKAVKLLSNLKNETARLATTLSQQSTCIYEKTNNIPKALAVLDHAISLAQKNQLEDQEQATIYNETALIYRKLAIFDKAYQYNLIAKDKWLLAKDYQGVYFMLRNLIVAATDMAKYELAQQHIDELSIFAQQHSEFSDSPFYINYHSAVLARSQNKWLKAILLFEKTLKFKNLTSNTGYIRAAYEQLSLMHYRNNQPTKSFQVLSLLEQEFPGLPPIKKEVTPLIMVKNGQVQAALNHSYKLLEQSESKKKDFVKKSTATAAQIHNDNLKQLDNLLLKQRFNYLAVIAILIITLLLLFLYIQFKRRKLLKHEKEAAALLLSKKNQILADVSHELSTPLTVLKLQVESLKDDLEEDVHVTYNALDNKLDDIQHLIDDIHQLAQSDVGALQLNIEPFELNETLDCWQEELTKFVNKNKLEFEINRELPTSLIVNLDKERLKQIFTNLLTNSIKYTDKPGEVKLIAKAKKNILLLSIEDSAPSVSEDDLTNIFERLYRVEGSRSRDKGGSGLGLAICKSLIEAHGGEIYAEHSDLGGLKVIIQIPLLAPHFEHNH